MNFKVLRKKALELYSCPKWTHAHEHTQFKQKLGFGPWVDYKHNQWGTMIRTKPQITKIPITFWVLKIKFSNTSNIQTNKLKKQVQVCFKV